MYPGSEVTQRLGAFATEHDKLSSFPRTQILEGEDTLTKVVLCLPYVPRHATCPPKQINAKNFKCKLLASWLQGAQITLETHPGRDPTVTESMTEDHSRAPWRDRVWWQCVPSMREALGFSLSFATTLFTQVKSSKKLKRPSQYFAYPGFWDTESHTA